MPKEEHHSPVSPPDVQPEAHAAGLASSVTHVLEERIAELEQRLAESDAHHKAYKIGLKASALLVGQSWGKAEYTATHDELTGLENKAMWKYGVNKRIQRGEAFGIAFMDLDAFKKVNDTYGHGRGDELLVTFADFLQGRLRREGDTLARESLYNLPQSEVNVQNVNNAGRFGGDEFAMTFDLHKNSRRGEHLTERMDKETDYLEAAVKEFVDAQPDDIKELGFNVSIGYAAFSPDHPVDASTLMKQADESMYEHKDENGSAR